MLQLQGKLIVDKTRMLKSNWLLIAKISVAV